MQQARQGLSGAGSRRLEEALAQVKAANRAAGPIYTSAAPKICPQFDGSS